MCCLLAAAAACATEDTRNAARPAGSVQFYQIANSPFDVHTRTPSAERQAWMRRYYAKMQTWSTYFDKRLSWYPGAWAYKDSYAIKPDWLVYRTHPEWILRDAEGQALYIPYDCGAGRCPQFAADVGNPDFREWWIAEAAELVRKGYRGLWVDDVNLAWRVSDGTGKHVRPIDPRTGEPMTLEAWQRNFATFMHEIRAQFPNIEIAHNVIWYAARNPATNPHVVNTIRAADYINLERGASDRGLRGGDGRFGFDTFLKYIDFVHAEDRAVILMDEATNTHERDFALAGWLLISTGHDLVASENKAWTTPANFWRGYALNLGAAAGPRFRWQELYRRDFQCGTVLLNPPDAHTQTVRLPRGLRTLAGRAAESTTLAARRAVILLNDQGHCQRDVVAPEVPWLPLPDARSRASES